ncbi:hypothetical protein VTN77DRAFT_9079 [Rasamsonia byssochlamydoides]|uniref:uncharacterized protein n=1 Tax=Rasamsonia byssochlamydoides TaxID=89139 RepID=UPI003742E6F3
MEEVNHDCRLSTFFDSRTPYYSAQSSVLLCRLIHSLVGNYDNTSYGVLTIQTEPTFSTSLSRVGKAVTSVHRQAEFAGFSPITREFGWDVDCGVKWNYEVGRCHKLLSYWFVVVCIPDSRRVSYYPLDGGCGIHLGIPHGPRYPLAVLVRPSIGIWDKPNNPVGEWPVGGGDDAKGPRNSRDGCARVTVDWRFSISALEGAEHSHPAKRYLAVRELCRPANFPISRHRACPKKCQA